MDDIITRDPERDPALAAALREAFPAPPEPDVAALRARISADAELPLARLRRAGKPAAAQAPAKRAVRWRPLVPLAAAAGVAGTVFALATGVPGRTDPAPRVSEADRQQVEQILNESVPDVREMVAPAGGNDALLTALGS